MCFENLSDDHSPSSAELFLDTSIHCSKLKGSLFQQRITDVFDLFQWKSTSTYTQVEFGNVVLAQAEYYLRELNKFRSLEKLKDHIGNALWHKSHSIKITWSFNLLAVYGQNDAECTERAKLSLQRMMKLGVDFVEKLCDRPLQDGTNCYWASRGVCKKRDGTLVWKSPQCKPNRKRCHLDDFFDKNRGTFKQIKDAIDKLPESTKSKQLNGFSEVIGLALVDSAILLDYRTGCKRLADAIIAVDSKEYRSMFSQNVKESELLTSVLGQAFYYLPPNCDKGVKVRVVDD